MGELVPYINGMQQGQGYNTYLQELCVRNAVTVEGSENNDNPFHREYHSDYVSDYRKLAESLKVSAGAAVSGWGQSGKVDVSVLDQSEVESTTLTYQVEVLVQHQGNVSNKFTFNDIKTDNPVKTYGDRFITDFVRGGQFLARVSITVKNSSRKKEIKESAEVAFTMYGTEGKVTQEVESAVEDIKQNSTVRIAIYESTGTSKSSTGTAKISSSETSDLLAVKEKADKFYDEASSGKHNYMLFAVLGKYTNLSDFNNRFKPLDYSEANKRSWALFDDFTRYQAIEKLIKTIPANKYNGGSTQLSELLDGAIKNSKKIRDRILLISENPDESRNSPDHVPPTTFRLEVLRAIKRATYIAQSRPVQGSDNWTDIASTVKYQGATEIFKFESFDFGELIGTRVVSFGKSTSREDYICLIGERASNIDGWKEESHFWVLPEMVDDFTNKTWAAGRIASKNYIRLYAADQSDIDNPRRNQFFYFFTA
ncbi:uncharacterized protein K452DRAFT_322970 [Aplosporella prunicola CBS 121167]|uniref:Uncharacterized protein n=1 Tax=Aplosporella prunicola CBS 121167 TaxID=1176127 RepID=A0A6A6AXC7_9PEZI|nr:uncharacterized protein K452DRAFT_322970 [Aplosporella prunicola CBS 121167]KAF2135584.1 hypothetical protein K452DRAFT_322970 [Aplosporella prunicola CBS 121167]